MNLEHIQSPWSVYECNFIEVNSDLPHTTLCQFSPYEVTPDET